MRIRLLIERNELPSVSILWSFTPSQLSSTIAQFLESVNVRFPLEGNTWGLEDYTVSLGGYEAQHYTPVGEVFKEDDEVVIKPLLFAEARARTISGRYQITGDGRRLVDGVPFGKPLLKRMRRPEVDIPPARKRARVEEMTERTEVRFEELEDEEDENDEEDGDFEDSEDDGSDVEVRVQLEGLEENGFAHLLPEQSDDVDSSSNSSDSGEDDAQDVPTGASLDDVSDSSNSETSSDASSSSDSDDGVDEEEVESDSSSDSSSSNISWTGIETSDDIIPAAVPNPSPPIPYKGAARTKERNIRRREAARLKHLKESGELPNSTTLQQMKEWIRTGELPPVSDNERGASQKQSASTKERDSVAMELEKKRQQLISDIDGGGIDVSAESTAPGAVPDNMHPPQMKKSKKKSKVSTPLADDEGPEEIPIATEPVAVYPVFTSTPTITAEDSSAAAPTDGPKRVSAAQRLIYGSLGLKAPNTQADKDALQKKLADRSRKSAVEVPVAEQEAADEDPEAWREKVIISAVECLDEGIELTEPPFPFRQKWDPQYWSHNAKKRNASRGGEGGNNKKRKNKGCSEVVEIYDKYNQDGGGDALNYDDPVDEDDEEWDDGEDWQEGALLDADEEEEDDDGFPTLPEDPTTLASLSEADAQVGDFVVFTEMACSDATGWQPKIVTTVGCLDAHDEGAWSVRISTRGGEKEYDDEGNRIYKKFEMEGFDDDDVDDNIKEMAWVEMMDVKLLLRPAVVEEQAGDVSINQIEGGGVDEQIQSQIEEEMGKEASSEDQ